MEAVVSKRNKSRRTKEKEDEVLGGEIPEPPKLKDFLADDGGQEEVEVEDSTSSTSVEVMEDVNDSHRISNSNDKEISQEDSSSLSKTVVDDCNEESTVVPVPAEVSESLSDEASSISVDPCEEALEKSGVLSSSASASAPEEADRAAYTHLYPILPLTLDSLTSMPSLTSWVIPSPVHITSAKSITVPVGENFISIQVPTDVLSRYSEEIVSKIQQLYSNMILEESVEKVKEFLKSSKTTYDGFELYELLCSYQRAYNQLSGCEKVLNDLKDQLANLEKELWTVEHETLEQTSTCMDGNVVSASHKYQIAKFSKPAYTQLDKVLKGTKELIKDNFSLFTYSVQLCKTQINHFFHKSFKDINLQSFEVQGYYSGYPTGELQNCATLLRSCISTICIYLRRSSTHIQVRRDCQKWLTDCVGLLVRVATLDDHLFILNHVIRCPPGVVGKGLACCVQIPKIPIPSCPEDYLTSGFSNLNLDYALTVLKIILNPVPQRDEFLKHVEIGVKTIASQDPENQWVVVDSDGEDDPDDVCFFKESDIIKLLHQIPFDDIFRRILFISKVQNQDNYDPSKTSERSVLKLLAFSTQLVEILGQGFVSYYTDRYRLLIKMIGRLILHCVQYVTDHIESLTNCQDTEAWCRKGSLVRTEYDLFFRTAAGVSFSGKNIGSLQFLAAMPFHLVSPEMLWHIYSAITKWTVTDPNQTDISSEFENELVSMNESDVFYLLNTLCNMATSRDNEDEAFTRIVTFHLFQIGFLSPLTRDCCSKTARDLLGNMTRKYPEIISVLLHTINSKIQILDTLSLYLMKELSFDLWRPTDADLKLIFHWLVTFPTTSVENQTARFVILSMNWGFDGDENLYLPFDIHYQIALIVMESSSKWEKASFISEGMKQISSRAQDLWAWDLLKRLHLHAFDRVGSYERLDLHNLLNTLPTFEGNSELECVRKGVELKNPLACFLSLYLTPVGHSVPLMCSKGFDILDIVVQSYRLEYVIQALFFITPLFADSAETLSSLEKFKNIITVILAADMTYVRMAKNLITTDFPGETTKLFGEMISAQISQCSRFGLDERSIIGLWTECLTKLSGWNKDSNILYLLDILGKASFMREDCHAYFMEFFSTLYTDMPQTSQSGLSSIFNWGTPVTTLLLNPTYNQIPFFSYYILNIEMGMENRSGFWKTLCVKLHNPKTVIDTAVKKASHSSKFATSPNFLTIYRWAQLALDLPVEHELTLLVWQKFFLRYFHRVAGSSQTTQYTCVASRFFEGMINTSFFNRLKKKLQDVMNHYKEQLLQYASNLNSFENASENPTVVREFMTDRINLASAMVLWIEDNQLLQPTLYLPALAPQFLPTMLMSLMDGEETLMNNYIDFEALLHEEKTSTRTFLGTIYRGYWLDGYKLPRFSDLRLSSSNCVEDLLKRLNSYDLPKPAPDVPVFEDILPSCPPAMTIDASAMKRGLEPHFKELRTFSKSFVMQISQLLALNCAYWESLPDLYTNSPAELVVNARCGGRSGGRNWETCAGFAQILFKYTEAKLNENLGHQIHQNRIEYQICLDEKGTKPPPDAVCVSAVFVEDFITNLVMHYRRASMEGEERSKVATVGSELFYYATSLVNDDTEFYPPTRQLLSSLLEVLGREFISTLPNQSHRLVTTSIRNPKLVGSLAPHLNLVNCQPPMLIDIYREVSSIPRRNVDLTFVILTKFDINKWLNTARPKLNDRSQLIQIIWRALCMDGFSPEQERLMVHDTYRNHFRNMLIFDFPQHYGEALNLLLEGVEQSKISPQIVFDFCNCLSRDSVRFSPGMDQFLRKREAKRFATEGSILAYQELIDTARLLGRHFTGHRLANGLYGLYSKYRNYIEPLSCFLQMIAHSLVAYSLKNSRGTLSQNIVDAVWPVIKEMYSPWMLPYNQKFVQQNCAQWIQHMNFDASSVLQPWIASDADYAMIVVNDFTDCLMFLVETLPGNTSIFSHIWNFYVENYAFVGVKDHVVGVVHNCFVSIPWAQYWPSYSDVELMCKIVEKFLPACHSFLSIVFAQIAWVEWVGKLSPKYIGRAHAMILNLTVRLANDTVARDSPTWIQVMETAETKMNWFSISPASLEPILNWLVMSIDPRVVLNLDGTHRMDKALLRLLETACGYGHQEEVYNNTSCNSIELNSKRYSFVRAYVRLIVSASSKHKNLLDSNPKAFEDAIKNMLSELAISVKLERQPADFFMSHLRELLGLMANHNLGTVARNAILEWCNSKESHSLVFLMTVIQLSCSVKVKPYIVCPLVETVINLCFLYPDASWAGVKELTVVNPEEMNNFFDICSKDGHYLMLYSLLQRKFSHFIERGLDTICFFTELLKNIKPKETGEEALPLIYDEILKVVVQIHIEALHGAGNETVLKHEKKFLLAFAQHASLFGDDRQGWGLLGALGIGKSSQLSIRGRLFAKCVGAFIFCQLPVNGGIRVDPGSEGHCIFLTQESPVKPHPEVQSCLEKLESLKQSRQHTDLIECIDFATEFIKDPNNALSSSELFISKLNGYLFSARFLVRS